MNIVDYRKFYLDLTLGILGGNHAHFKITMHGEFEQKAKYDNYRRGLTVLALISLIESNFLAKKDLKRLRNFQPVLTISPAINQLHLSGFLYLRDCFAHNPFANVLSPGGNSTAFLTAINSGNFPFASISANKIHIIDTHELHLLVLRFFGENV